jgi:hypothetical protein
MSEKAPNTNNSDIHPGAQFSRRDYYTYQTDIITDPSKHRHPLAQAEIEKVFGEEDGRGSNKSVVIYDEYGNTSEIVNRLNKIGDKYGQPGNEDERYEEEAGRIIPALRGSDIEREFHTERL